MTYNSRSVSKRIGIGEQIAWINQRWRPTWSAMRRDAALIAVGIVRPDEIAREYRIQLTYGGGVPSVRVLDPVLQRRHDGKPIPHTYPGDRLCLYHPQYGEWTAAMLLADTVIPWVSEWLYWYEIWLVTGDWLGGGEHPKA